MDPTPIPWHQLSMVLAVLGATAAFTVGLLSVALPRRGSWAACDRDQSRYRGTEPAASPAPCHPLTGVAARPAAS